MKKERKTDSRASARACVLWTGALTLQKGAVRARCAERKTEKETLREREREQGERARARVLWTAYWALVLLLSSMPTKIH